MIDRCPASIRCARRGVVSTPLPVDESHRHAARSGARSPRTPLEPLDLAPDLALAGAQTPEPCGYVAQPIRPRPQNAASFAYSYTDAIEAAGGDKEESDACDP